MYASTTITTAAILVAINKWSMKEPTRETPTGPYGKAMDTEAKMMGDCHLHMIKPDIGHGLHLDRIGGAMEMTWKRKRKPRHKPTSLTALPLVCLLAITVTSMTRRPQGIHEDTLVSNNKAAHPFQPIRWKPAPSDHIQTIGPHDTLTETNRIMYSVVHSALVKPKPKPLQHGRVQSLLVMYLILLQAGDLELNPGPRAPKFPCGLCGKAVTWKNGGPQCDGCDVWYHQKCLCMSTPEYTAIGEPSVVWKCEPCGRMSIMNISVSLFTIETSNSFDPLNSASLDDTTNTLGSVTSPGPPKSCSSPRKTNKQGKRAVLKILNVNCQSAKAKKQQLHHMIHTVKPDVIIGTESWLKQNDIDDECAPKDLYEVYRKDRKHAKGGGVFVAISRDLVTEEEPELDTDCEIIWCKISIVGLKTLHIGAYYRPHEGDEKSLDELQKSLSRLGDTDQSILLGGDFNFPGWDWKNKRLTPGKTNYPGLHQRFGELLNERGLEQMVEEPTRGEATLDLMVTNNPTRISKVQVIPGISDHDCVLIDLDQRVIRHKQTPRQIPLYKKAQWEELEQHMRQAGEEIKEQANTASADTLWELFSNAIQEGVRKFIPHKTCKARDNLPWVTPEIRKMIKRKNRLSYKKRKSRNFNRSSLQFQTLSEKIRLLNKNIQKEMRRAYWNHIESLITPGASDGEYTGMKRFWTFIKHQRKDASGVAPLKRHGVTTSTPKGKADILNQQFESVFTHETPPTEDLLPTHSPYPRMADITFTTPGVEKILKNLNAHKAAGPDDISPRILKELATTIAPILTVIFNRSYETGEVPMMWRRANVVPIYKKGAKCDPANYRPISLTCIVCKLMEHIIASNIMRHGNNNNILYDLQHGFRAKRSCETQLIEFSTDLHNNLQNGKQTDVLVLDFSKAFDKVGHKRLIRKLHHYGIGGKTNKWIESFLSTRTQTVVLDGERSYEGEVVSGVPQGSVLGPCLFLYYINDLPEGLSSKIRLFADDTIIYIAVSSTEDATILQADLDRLADWETKWMMEFHPAKCQVLTITKKRKQIRHNYTLRGTSLEHVNAAKYLGVTFTSDLRWNTHITNISNKANRTLGFIRRNLQIQNEQLKITAYNTLVRPQLEYASSVWDPHTINNINKLEKVQRTAARYVKNRWRRKSSVGNMIQQLGWPPLSQRREQQRLGTMYKIHHGQVEVNINHQYIQPAQRSTRTSHALAYQLPYSANTYHQNSYFPRTVTAWNALPETIVMAPSVEAFKARLAAQYQN